jgi:hypothetical protein
MAPSSENYVRNTGRADPHSEESALSDL